VPAQAVYTQEMFAGANGDDHRAVIFLLCKAAIKPSANGRITKRILPFLHHLKQLNHSEHFSHLKRNKFLIVL